MKLRTCISVIVAGHLLASCAAVPPEEEESVFDLLERSEHAPAAPNGICAPGATMICDGLPSAPPTRCSCVQLK
jgi:hypothetical protein